MATSPVSNNTQTTVDTALKSPNKSLDKDAFLKLLITQLQNQDPMSPTDDKEFMAQMAQFSSLEQMQQLNQGFGSMTKSTAAASAFAMIGHTIDYADLASGSALTGKVGSVSFEDGMPKLNIGSSKVDVENVLTVYP